MVFKGARFWSLIFYILSGLLLQAQKNDTLPEQKFHRLSYQTGRSVFTLSGNYRLRTEFQRGYNVKTYGIVSDELFLLSRLRLHSEYRFDKWLAFFLEIQDARVFGSSFSDEDFEGKNNPFHDPFDINKLFITLRPIDSLEIILGRQALNIADRRVFGPGDWGNTGRYIWDAANIRFGHRLFSSRVIFGYNIKHEPDVFPNMAKEGPYALAFYNTIRKLPVLLDLFYIYKFDKSGDYSGEQESSGNLHSNYFGGRVIKTVNQTRFMALGAYQTGSLASNPISAYGLVVQVSQQTKLPWKPEILFTFIAGSGDKNPEDGRIGTFDGIFSGADTDLYSWMNFTYWKNVRQARADLLLRPVKTILFRAEYHLYWLDQPKDAWYSPGKVFRKDPEGISGNFIGQEIDLTLRMEILKWLQFLGGYCFFIPGEFAKNTGEHPLAQWAFAQVTLLF